MNVSDVQKKPTAFVIQSFDGGRFDKRYVETIRPALLKAGVEPQRADQILGLQPIIHKIEQAIRNASICVAEVSTDNANVWLELGYALSLDRPTVILCDRHIRDRLPFDIQHRPVIFYSTDSKSGYEELEEKITAEVRNQLEIESRLDSIPAPAPTAPDTKDLKGYEVAILATVLAVWPNSPGGIVPWEIEKRLERSGYSDTQTALGITKLLEAGYLEQQKEYDDRDGQDYFIYRITPMGIRWLHQNEDAIKPVQKSERPNNTQNLVDDFSDSDIPF